MINHHTLFISFILSLLLGILSTPLYAQEIKALSQEKFDQKVSQAYENNNKQQIKNLIQNNRFLTKPLVERLLTKSIHLELQQRVIDSKEKFQLAQSLASLFWDIHQERSLLEAVGYISSWTRNQKEQKLIADSLYTLGTKIRGKKDQREQAMDYYQQALNIYQQIGDQRGEGSTLGGIGFLYFYKNDADQMHHYVQKALEVRIACDDKQLMGNSYSDLGYFVYWNFYNDHSAALKNLKESEKIRREIGDDFRVGKTLLMTGQVYESMGKLPEASQHYATAAEMYEKIGEKKQQSTALYKCAVMQKKLGRYLEALKYLERSLAIREALGNNIGIADVLSEKGNIYIRMGEYELAYNNYQKMLALMEQEGDENGIAGALTNIGMLLGNLGRYQEEIEIFQRSLDIFTNQDDKEGILEAMSNLGLAHFDNLEYSSAEKYYLEALQLSRSLNNYTVEVNNLINLGNVQNCQGKLDEALTHYNAGLQIAREVDDPDQVWRILLGIGDNYERRGAYESALSNYVQSLEILEGMRSALKTAQYKASFFALKRYVYDTVVHILCQLHKQDENLGYDIRAFEYAERGKARAFLDLMAESLENVYRGADKDLLEQQEQIIRELSYLEQTLSSGPTNKDNISEIKDQIKATEESYQKVKTQIREKNPAYADLQYPQPKTLTEIQSEIPDDKTVVLTYFIGDSSSALWVLRKNSHQLFVLPDNKSLQEPVEVVRHLTSNPQSGTPQNLAQSSHRLYQMLIHPADHLINNGDEVIIIPDGLLHYLPFEILISKKLESGQDTTYSDLPYLVRHISISYAPSATIWAGIPDIRNNRPASFTKSLLAFGDPVFAETEKLLPVDAVLTRSGRSDLSAGGLERLIYSGTEVREISALFPEDKVDLCLRDSASEKALKKNINAGQYQYVHLASHGLINERQPDFSSIVLAQDKESDEDGLLQAAEIFNLPISSELVVLSACQTGMGKMVRGEGMIGLSRAFMYAGTPSVLVSLWRVSDQSTAQLMVNFYRNLIAEKMAKSEALRQAQIKMIEDKIFAHPFYWAPFILIGDAQ